MDRKCSPPCNDLLWEYECWQCGARFSVKVPKGPTEERALRCPHCAESTIIKISTAQLAEAFCGG